MRLAFLFGIVGFGAFLLMDAALGRTSSVASMTRLVILPLFIGGLAFTYWRSTFAARHYSLIVNFYSILAVLVAALLPVAIYGQQEGIEVYWSLDTSLTMVVVVTYGFNRLPARNTAAIVVPGCLIGVLSVFLLPSLDTQYFGRLLLHVTIVNVVAFYFRATLESRERRLFLLARENLSKNIYAKELEAAYAQAKEGNEVKLRFLANMSHEFRNPMSGILQTLDVLSRDAGDGAQRLVVKARESGQALLSTLNSILDYTSWTQKGLTPKLEPTSLSELIGDLVEQHRDEAVRRNLSLVLRLDLTRSEEMVLVDKAMVRDAVSRIFENAIRFTTKGGVRVSVEMRRRESKPFPAAEVKVSIADTGIGIAPELHEAIFAAFYQVDSASTRDIGGSGLGLAIARRLIDAMGGRISLDSETGVGTTVCLQFPTEICRDGLCPTHSFRAPAPRLVSTVRQQLQGSVLVVEDNEFNAAMLVELLGLMGLKAEHACDGEEAHRMSESRCFDLVLMDCQMPRVDGYEATKRIRESEARARSARVPIIALTANALSHDRDKCLDAGMDDYLAKPYTASELYERLVQWLPSQPQVDPPVRNRSTAPIGNQEH